MIGKTYVNKDRNLTVVVEGVYGNHVWSRSINGGGPLCDDKDVFNAIYEEDKSGRNVLLFIATIAIIAYLIFFRKWGK